jgi:hypothetical protein
MTKTGWGFGISVIVICVIFVICDLEFLVTLVLQNSWQSLPLCGLYPVPTTHGRVQSTVHAKGNDLTFIVYEGHGHIGIFPLFWIILCGCRPKGYSGNHYLILSDPGGAKIASVFLHSH